MLNQNSFLIVELLLISLSQQELVMLPLCTCLPLLWVHEGTEGSPNTISDMAWLKTDPWLMPRDILDGLINYLLSAQEK